MSHYKPLDMRTVFQRHCHRRYQEVQYRLKKFYGRKDKKIDEGVYTGSDVNE